MRYVATTAAVFGAAIFMAAGSHASISGASNFNNIISKPAVLAVAHDPGQTALAHTAAANTSAGQQPAASRTVTVSTGDNLTELASANGTTYQRLYDANPAVDNPDLIFPGQQLRIPSDNENLTARPLPDNAPAAVVQSAQPDAAAAAPQTSAAEAPAPQPSAAPAVADGSVWDQIAACESGGNWAINTGNGFYGGLQFTLASWQGVGGSGMPNQASREEQIARAQLLQSRGGWGNWPVCSAKLGLY